MNANLQRTRPQQVWFRSLKCWTLLTVIAWPIWSPAAQVTLQPGVNGYTGTTDAWLDESQKHDNYGGAPNVRIQYNSGVSDHTLIKFTLPSVTFQSIPSATLGLYYYDSSSMVDNNALWITPYRLATGAGWDENTGDGLTGQGVNWTYRDIGETLLWSGSYGAWNDKLDDGNSTTKIKRIGGTVTNAIAPPAWVTWSVQNSVSQWYSGQANNGFVLFESGFEGSGSIVAGLFTSRENGYSGYNPYLTITYSGAWISWNGLANANWDAITANWTVGGYRGTYSDGDFVTFADGASNPGISVAGGGISPGSITISNNSTTYNFSGGSSGGSGGATKQGTGLATLSAANGYTGLTLVQGGRLVVAANGALGTTGSGTIVSNGAALGFQGGVNYSTAEPVTILGGGGGGGGALYAVSGNNTFAGPVTLAAHSTVGVTSGLGLALNGAISGGYNLTKTGQGTLSFGGGAANTYGGTTYVNQGTLALSALGTIPNSPVIDVAAGATFDVSTLTGGFTLGAAGGQTLKGSGTVNGDVATTGLARLEPGDSPGTLTFLNNLSLAEGVTNYFELTNSLAIGGGTNDLIVVADDLTLNSNVIAITVLGPDPLSAGTYRLFNYAGAKTGSLNPTPVFLSGSAVPGQVTIDESVTNQINLMIVAPISTTTMVTSSQTPSLPGSNVTFTAAVSAVPPATNVPTGTVTFKTNDVAMGPPVALDNGVASNSTALLPHGFTSVKAEYPGQGLFLGSTGSVVQLVNTPPTPGSHVAYVYVIQNEPLVLPVATLLGNDSDPDNDPLTIIGVSRLSTNGGTAALVYGTNITYLPKPDYTGNDLLTYTLSDSYTTVSVPIYLSVFSYSTLTNSIVGITNLGGGTVTITCTGIPGRTYWMQAATNLLTPGYWTTLSTNIADTNGLWQCTDPGATNAEGYYRTATQTNSPDFRLFDAELLSLDISGGGLPPVMMIRESPTLQSLGVTRIRPLTNGNFTICSFFDVFTELSMNNGQTWFPATNGFIPLILVGGTPPNGFPTESLPPLAGQYITPSGWPEFYLQLLGPSIAIRDITLHSFTKTFPPPPPGMSSTNNFGALADLFVSWDGGHTFMPFTAPAQIQMLIKGRLSGP